MSIASEATVKSKFPQWENMCTLQGDSITAAERFTIAYDEAKSEMGLYITFSDDTATDQLNMLFTRLVRYHCFQFRHGDKHFENDPAIAKDYQAAIALLEKYQSGDLPNAEEPGDNADTITMDAKDRQFGTWFTDQYDDLSSTV